MEIRNYTLNAISIQSKGKSLVFPPGTRTVIDSALTEELKKDINEGKVDGLEPLTQVLSIETVSL
jgi:hypothetical protein